MHLVSSERRDELFDTLRRDAFHLELRDHYGSPVEDGPFGRWLRGEPDEHTWLEPWLSRMRTAAAAGRTVRRVRVVTEPHSPYVRWEHSLTGMNVAAGEDIRWLARHLLPRGTVLPVAGNDWWLFDDRLLAVGHFDTRGRVLGTQLVRDADTIARCTHVRDRLWPLATPHSDYSP